MVALFYVANVKLMGALSTPVLSRFAILVPISSILFFVFGLFFLFFKPSEDGYDGIELLKGNEAIGVALLYSIACIGSIALFEPTWFLENTIFLRGNL